MAKFFGRIDLLLLLPAILLSALGLMLIYSTSFESDPSFFVRQAGYLVFAIVTFIILSQLDFKSLSYLSPFVYAFVILLLIFTFIVGIEVRGSVRWVDLGFVTIQGAELAKPVIVLFLAYFFIRFPTTNFRNFLIAIILIVIPIVIIAKQPDLSNSLVLFSTWLVMIFISGVNLVYLLMGAGVVLIAVPFVWNLFLKTYQKNRLLAFLNPSIDPQGVSYNIVQALIALGSGQLTGKGLGRGTQSHLNFLPEGRTDFIFSVAGEELGFVGVALIILIFAFLIYRIIKMAARSINKETKLFIYGAAFILAIQFFINAAMNMGIFPVSGVTLPFISFGGSSIVSMFILLGLVQAAKNQTNK